MNNRIHSRLLKDAHALHYLVIVLVAVGIYAQSIGFGFVYDDVYVVAENPSIRSGTPVAYLFTDASAYATGLSFPTYRPLTLLSYRLDYMIDGLTPALYHLHNVLMHAVNGCLVFSLVLMLMSAVHSSRRQEELVVAALIGAGVWLLHPVHTEVVAWVKSRDELQCGFFLLGACIWLTRCLRLQKLGVTSAAIIAVLLICALLSKETAVVFPLLVVLLAWAVGARARRSVWTVAGVSAIVVAAFVAIRTAVLGSVEQTPWIAGSFYREMLVMLRAGVRYIRLALAPGELLADYSGFFDIRTTIWHPEPLLSAAVLLVVIACAVVARRRAPLITLGIAWFGVLLLPVSNLVSTMQFLAERFMYLPLVGLAMLAAEGTASLINWAGKHRPNGTALRPQIWMALPLLVLVAEGGATLARLPVWRNELSLFHATYRDASPRASRRVRLHYAVALFNEERYDEAREVYEQLVRETPETATDRKTLEAVRGYGIALMLTGNLDEGIIYSERALRIHPTDAETLRHIAYYHERKGDLRRALEALKRAGAVAPGDPRIQLKIEDLRGKLGNSRE